MSLHQVDVPDYDVVPGTVYIIQGAHQAGFSSQDIILVPTPSSDPADPLRWSKWRKAYHLLLLVFYSATLGAITNSDSVVYLNLMKEYKTTTFMMNIGAAVNLLLLGAANVFLVPLSNKYGRRCVYILTLLLVLVSEIWFAVSKTNGDYQGAAVLRGIGAAPFEALPAISIADIYFAHERGGRIGYYVFGLAFGSFVGPICAGYMAANQGWRMMYWWGVIVVGAFTVIFYLTFEETNFIRPIDPHDEGLRQAAKESDLGHEMTDDDLQKSPSISKSLSQTESEPAQAVAGEVFDAKGFRIQLGLFKSYPMTWSAVFTEWWLPVKCCTIPAVFWCGVNYGTCVSWLSVMGTTVALIFATPPYLFSNDGVGLVWLSPMIGSLIGAYFSGPLNDRFTLYLSNRNRGWREPEFRLWPFIPAAFIMPAGLIIYGVTAAHGLHWIAPVVGMGLVGFGLSVGGAVTMGYILDSYKEIDTQVVTTIILIRNIIGFGITFGIQPWIDGVGLQNTFICVGCLSFAVTIFAGVFIVFGKTWRRATTKRYRDLALIKAM